MSIYAIIPLIALIAYLPLLSMVLLRRPKQREHKLFAVFLVAAILWSLTSFLLHSGLLLNYKALVVKVMAIAALWMVTQYYAFVHLFGYKPDGFGVKLGYGSVLLFAVLFFVLGYGPKEVSFTLGKPVAIEWDLSLYLLAFPALVIGGELLFALVKRLRLSTDPVERNRISYLLGSLAILAVAMSTNVLPLFRGYPIDHLGNMFNAIILTYVTLRYELVSVRPMIRRGLSYAITATIIGAFYLFIYWLIHSVFGVESYLGAAVLTSLITVLLFAGFFFPLQRFSVRVAEQIFYGERLNYRKDAFDFVRRTQSILKLDEIGKELLRIATGISGATSAYLLLPDKGQDFIRYQAVFSRGIEHSSAGLDLMLRQDSPIVSWLLREGRYLRREELDILPEFTSLWREEKKVIDAYGVKLFLPLIARDNLVGILTLAGMERKIHYDIEDLDLLQMLTSQAATVIDNTQLYVESKELAEDLQLINRLTGVISSSLRIEEIYETFVAELRQVMDADWVSVALIEGDQLHFFALATTAGSAWQAGESIPLKGTATAYVAETRKTFVERDLLKHHRFWTGKVHLKQGIRSIVSVPLIARGVSIGALIVGSRRPDAYNARQIALLEQICGQLATAVENFKLYGHVQEQAITDDLTTLFNRRYFEKRLNEEIDRCSRYGGNFSLAMCDLDFFKKYNDIYGHEAGDKLLQEIARMLKEKVRSVDLVFRYGGDEFTILMPETTIEEAYTACERLRLGFGKAMAGKEVAVTISLGLASWPKSGLTADEIVRAADSALYWAKSIGGNHTVLFSEVISSPVEDVLAQAKDEAAALSAIHALVAAVNVKDHYTSRHSQLVTAYATALAEAAGLPKEKIYILRNAALLHDVGKIGIPDEILTKKEELTAEEWETLKSHCVMGVTILSRIPSLAQCLPIILHHHERYDGLGYPKGLRGETIPLEAQILALADAFVAMISARPYRSPLSYKEAIKELKRGAGTQFNPKLVELFIPIALSLVPEEVMKVENSRQKPAVS